MVLVKVDVKTGVTVQVWVLVAVTFGVLVAVPQACRNFMLSTCTL
jgi:hypothetical protein